jgi:hypothetical protein
MVYVNSSDPFPATEEGLIAFVASMSHLTEGTLSQYLSAVRSKSIDLGWKWMERSEMPQLQRVLRGFSWMQRARGGGRLRMALTFDVLKDILTKKWSRHQEALAQGATVDLFSMDHPIMASAVYSTGLCGLLRPSEFSVRQTGKGYTSSPLLVKHFNPRIDTDSDGTTSRVKGASLYIPSRKCHQDGFDVEMGFTGDATLCGVAANLRLLAERNRTGAPASDYLFPMTMKDGTIKPLTYEMLTSALEADLKAAGYNAAHYKGHSFRIGGATTLAQNGVPTAIIEDMGGWVRGSLALPRYVRDMSSAAARRHFMSYMNQAYQPRVEDPAPAGFLLWGK